VLLRDDVEEVEQHADHLFALVDEPRVIERDFSIG
jgi:hypothetical protein